MRSPGFWWRAGGRAARLLHPLAWAYGKVADARLAAAGQGTTLPVLCIGNLVAGGAGKTPTALAVARRLVHLGHAPIFLTRGYGGRQAGPLLVDPTRHDSREVGDEALLLAERAPTILARDRVAGAAFAIGHGGVLVLDDGFQNPALRKDLSILVVDGPQGIGNGALIPAGPLRASLQVQLSRAGAIVLIGEGPGSAIADRAGLPVLRAELRPIPGSADGLGNKRLLAYCGIGRPEKFFAFLAGLQADIVETRTFGDHHRFSDADARALLRRAEALGARLVTTAKDAARFTGSEVQQALAAASTVVRIELAIEDEAALDDLLSRTLAARLA